MLNKSKGIILLMLIVMFSGCTKLQYGPVTIPDENPLEDYYEYERTLYLSLNHDGSEYSIKSASIIEEMYTPPLQLLLLVNEGYGFRGYDYSGSELFDFDNIANPVSHLKVPFTNNLAVIEFYKYNGYSESRITTFTSEQIMRTAEYGPYSDDSGGYVKEHYESPSPPITLNMEVQFINNNYELVYVEILDEPFKPYPQEKILRQIGHGVRGSDYNGNTLFNYDNEPKPIHAVHAPFSDELYSIEFYDRSFHTEKQLTTFTIDDIFRFIDYGFPEPTPVPNSIPSKVSD